MKKKWMILLVVILLLATRSARAESFRIPTGVQGMVTGALIGSVFGPNKKVRGTNAVIGAVSGYLIGNQFADKGESPKQSWMNKQRSHNSRANRYPVTQTVIIPPTTQQQTVVIYKTPPVEHPYQREVRTVYSSPYSGSQTIIIERTTPVVVYKNKRRDRRYKRYRKHNRRHQRDYDTY